MHTMATAAAMAVVVGTSYVKVIKVSRVHTYVPTCHNG
jgi:hypothetical protein